MGRTALLYSTGAKTQVMGYSEVRRRIKAMILLTGTCTDLSIVFPYSPFSSALGNDPVIFTNLHGIAPDQQLSY